MKKTIALIHRPQALENQLPPELRYLQTNSSACPLQILRSLTITNHNAIERQFTTLRELNEQNERDVRTQVVNLIQTHIQSQPVLESFYSEGYPNAVLEEKAIRLEHVAFTHAPATRYNRLQSNDSNVSKQAFLSLYKRYEDQRREQTKRIIRDLFKNNPYLKVPDNLLEQRTAELEHTSYHNLDYKTYTQYQNLDPFLQQQAFVEAHNTLRENQSTTL